MKRHTPLWLILFFFLVFTGNLCAQERNMQELKETARTHFLNQSARKTGSPLLLAEESTPTLAGSSSSFLAGVEKESFYIFKKEGRGFVILSADQRMPEVLGYSNEGTLQTENIPDGLKTLLASYQIQAEQLENESANLQEETAIPEFVLPEEKKPLLNGIAWTQDYPYSNHCPESGGERTLAGCVTTAMSTLMAYYKYPEQGKGSVSYTWNGNTLKGDFSSHFYEWDKIRDTYSYINYGDSIKDLFSPEESREVAKLCYDVALSIQTSFGTKVSNSYNTVQLGINAFINNFAYDSNLQVLYRNYFSRAEWLSILQQELAEDRPVFYRGGETTLSGHVFIADGYDKDGLIHFDFGWGGVANGYYHIATISPDDVGAGATGGTGFNIDQFMFVGLQPPAEDSRYQSHLILNKALTASKTELTRSESFSLSSTLVNKGTSFSGTYLAMLYDEAGNSYEVCSPVSASLNMDASRNFSLAGCQIPETLPEGLYQLRIVAKDNKEKEWARVRSLSSVPAYCNVWITDKTIKLANASVSNTLREGIVTAEHALYKGLPGDFTLSLTNGENEFLGTIGVGALDGNSSYTVLANCIGSVQSEETISYSLSGTIGLSPGEYTLIPLYKENNQWKTLSLEGEKITVKATPAGTESLTCLDSEFPQNEQKVARSGMLEGTITLTNEGAPYSNGIVCAFFHNVPANSYNISSRFIPLFLDSGETITKTLYFPHNLPEGDYRMFIYKINANGNSERIEAKEKTRFDFTVVNDSILTGLSSPPSKDEPFTLEYGENEMILRSSQSLAQITLFTSSGIRISHKHIPEDSKEWKIPTDDLGNGIYLVRILLANGTWESAKFSIR